MIADIIVGFIVVLVILYVWYRAQNAADNHDWYTYTDTVSCGQMHQHMWKPTTQFPSVRQDGTVEFLQIYVCPVCQPHTASPERVNTKGRHKNPYETE